MIPLKIINKKKYIMSNVVSWIKFIYPMYNPVIRRFYYLLLNHSKYKIGIIMLSIFLFIIIILYLLNHKNNTQKKFKQNYDNDNKKKNKLCLLTKLNTIINEFIPIDFDSYKSYYSNILGNDFQSIYPKIFSSIKKNFNNMKNKKSKNKVSFDENDISFEI